MSAEDVSGAEEGDTGESQVLVQHEHTYWDEVWVTQVVDEAADVAIVAGVDTIHLPVLQRKHKRKNMHRLGNPSLFTQIVHDKHALSFKHFIKYTLHKKVHLVVQVKQVGVVFSNICLCVRDQLPDVSVWAERSFISNL